MTRLARRKFKVNNIQTLHVTARDRRALRVPLRHLLTNKLHEYWIKGTGRRIPGQGMIGAGPEAVREGFGSLEGKTFDQYNLPQAWVESRMIPQILHHRVPAHNARILDLGCGPGTSTRLLSWFAKPDWDITGLELIPHLVEQAQHRAAQGWFKTRDGETIQPTFHHANLTQHLPVQGPFDLAISGGVVGLYLLPDEAATLLASLRPLIRPGGWLALDAGPSIPPDQLRQLAEAAGFTFEAHIKSFIIEPRPKLLFHA